MTQNSAWCRCNGVKVRMVQRMLAWWQSVEQHAYRCGSVAQEGNTLSEKRAAMQRSFSPAGTGPLPKPPPPARGHAGDSCGENTTNMQGKWSRRCSTTRSCESPSKGSVTSANYSRRGEVVRQFRVSLSARNNTGRPSQSNTKSGVVGRWECGEECH
jgi:hypothetical protein